MALMESDSRKLSQGGAAPDFLLLGIDGKKHGLSDYQGAKALLIVFMCNHCPYVKAKFSRLNEIYGKYAGRGLAMVGINSNDAQNYPDDSFGNMKKTAAAQGFKFDYIYDENQSAARSYGAVCTPDPFLFDGNFKLAYHGRLDDALSPTASPTKLIMEEAIDAVMAGKKPAAAFLPSQGCSIKWK
jgi:peroxiredoxin